MCLMVMKHIILMTIKNFMPDKVSAKSFLTEIADRFTKSDKVEATMLLSKLIADRYVLQRQRKHKRVHYGNIC